MPSNSRKIHLWIVIALLALCSLPLCGDVDGRGGSVMASWPTSNPKCAGSFNYYMPIRVYHDPDFTSEINSVMQTNRADGAARAVVPVFYHDLNNPSACDEFYADSAGSLPPLFAQNFPALMSYLRQLGYMEVVLQMAPVGGLLAQCDSDQLWCGSSTQWGPAHEAILQRNLNFTINVLQFAFNNSNNAGVWIISVLNMPSIWADRNCADYDTGYCSYGGTANLLRHKKYGLEAKFVTRLWDGLANHLFYNGSRWFPGKEQIYGFETSYTPQNPAFQKIPTLYTVPEYGSVTITGLYQQTAASTPYVIALGSYPGSRALARQELNSVFGQLGRAGDQSGIIVIETWYNDEDTALGFQDSLTDYPSRYLWFLFQWPWEKPDPGHEVIPWRFDKYYAHGF